MLIGQYTHTIDPKKRLSLPSKWRKVLGDKVVMTRGLDGCVFVYSVSEWQKLAEKLGAQSVGSKEVREINRFFLSGAVETDIDSVGRILFPEFLKSFAGLGEKVVLAGLYSRIEVWDEDVWNRKQVEVADRADDVAAHLQSVGLI